MHEEISKYVAALNAAWQLYGTALEQQLDTVPMDALNRDFVAAQQGLAACGITKNMLVYDSATMTFSLLTGISAETMTFSLLTDIPADGWQGDDEPGSAGMQLV